jgi:hypothetical protein
MLLNFRDRKSKRTDREAIELFQFNMPFEAQNSKYQFN